MPQPNRPHRRLTETETATMTEQEITDHIAAESRWRSSRPTLSYSIDASKVPPDPRTGKSASHVTRQPGAEAEPEAEIGDWADGGGDWADPEAEL